MRGINIPNWEFLFKEQFMGKVKFYQMKKTFSIKVIILSLLTSILGGGLGGCIKKDNIFSRLNNQSIIIPTSDQR